MREPCRTPLSAACSFCGDPAMWAVALSNGETRFFCGESGDDPFCLTRQELEHAPPSTLSMKELLRQTRLFGGDDAWPSDENTRGTALGNDLFRRIAAELEQDQAHHPEAYPSINVRAIERQAAALRPTRRKRRQ